MKNLRIQLPAIFLIAGCLSGLTACLQESARRRFLIPNGYVGWIKIDYDVEGAPALPIEDGFYLLKFPPSGHLQTSSPNEFALLQDEHFYYSGSDRAPLKQTGWGGGGMVWAGYSGSSAVGPEKYGGLFIGTEEQYKSVGMYRKDENGRPMAGPIVE